MSAGDGATISGVNALGATVRFAMSNCELTWKALRLADVANKVAIGFPLGRLELPRSGSVWGEFAENPFNKAWGSERVIGIEGMSERGVDCSKGKLGIVKGYK